MSLMTKYATYGATRSRSETELRADFEAAQRFIAEHNGTAEAARLSVVRDWIAQRRRNRLFGIPG
jgi:hypothetical protein